MELERGSSGEGGAVGVDNSAVERGNTLREADTISSSDTDKDSHRRGTRSRFQYRAERNRESYTIAE